MKVGVRKPSEETPVWRRTSTFIPGCHQVVLCCAVPEVSSFVDSQLFFVALKSSDPNISDSPNSSPIPSTC
jgi:hypothetical protein